MQINKNRKGLALGAVFALVASLFVASAPAQASEDAAVIFPSVGTSTQTTMLITEEFDITFRYGTGVAAALRTYAPDTSAGFGAIITKPAGVTLSTTVNGGSAVQGSGTDITGTSVELAIESSNSNKVLSISLSDKTTVSTAVSITVQAFLDLDRDGNYDAGEPLGNTMTVNFVPLSALGAVLAVEAPVAGDIGATTSFTVTAGNVNWGMLDHDFGIKVVSTNDGTTWSAPISGTNLAVAATAAASTSGTTAAKNFSASYEVVTDLFTASPTVASVSATLYYNSVSMAVVTQSVQAVAAAGLSISPVAGDNAKMTAGGAADVRFNSAFTVRAFAYSASTTTSLAVANDVTVSGIANMEFDADSGVIMNGTTYTSSAAFLAAGFTLAAGTDTFAVSTFGQTDNASVDDTITLAVERQLQSVNVVLTLETTVLTPIYVPTTVSGLAGVSKTFAVAVEDQFGVAPVRTDLRIHATVALGGSTSDAVTSTVVAGAASVTVTPVPATRTGSATVTLTLQQFDQGTQAWVSGNTDTIAWNVYSYAAGTDAITSRTASISASISYGVDLSWSSVAIALAVANSFSDVTVAAPGLMIQYVDDTTMTASDTLTVAANGKAANFKFTSRLAGTYTVTFTNGTATTTSQVVVNPARDADGATITFDTTAIAAGSTKVITGTLVDINGNPVNTSGSATILVTYAPSGNAGIPIGTMPTETDADGEFSITVLTGANDAGTAVVTAVYYKNGAATAVADVLSFNASITVGGSAAVPASNQKLTVGSFKGFVAIYALNYTGQKLSAKVAGKWLVVEALASRYERVVRNTGAAIPIIVELYIDGVFVRTENIVTK